MMTVKLKRFPAAEREIHNFFTFAASAVSDSKGEGAFAKPTSVKIKIEQVMHIRRKLSKTISHTKIKNYEKSEHEEYKRKKHIRAQ
jgi:hypothetical protein